ncbi:MAG: precorrin-8X methylmutase [Caldilinea sp.]|nr:precorrin-8X methylmutase [Caldilinea sp.]MDW8441570.1 precorrin-8X methylmutase [Caldilineaceae bacterium]
MNLTPAAITERSFAIIRKELAAQGLIFAPPFDVVIQRIIHATADFEYAHITRWSEGAIEAGVHALRLGRPILADVQMVRVGVSAEIATTLGVSVHCFVNEPEVCAHARQENVTRTAAAIRYAAVQGLLAGAVVAIGNAPTALLETLTWVEQGVRPALIIGVPVGFVGTVESKALLTRRIDVPWITTEGRKGGSPVAVAIVNALLRLAAGRTATEAL